MSGYGRRNQWWGVRLRGRRLAGILTVLLALAAIGVIFFAPLRAGTSAGCTDPAGICWYTPVMLSELALDRFTVGFFVAMGAVAAVIGLFAAIDDLPRTLTRIVLTGGTTLWWIGAGLAVTSIGAFFVPAGIAAIVATTAAWRAQPR